MVFLKNNLQTDSRMDLEQENRDIDKVATSYVTVRYWRVANQP